MHRNDVRVVQVRDDPDFAEESRRLDRRAEFGAQDLNGDLTPEPQILSQENPGHPPGTDFPNDPVSILQGRPDSLESLGHGSGKGGARIGTSARSPMGTMGIRSNATQGRIAGSPVSIGPRDDCASATMGPTWTLPGTGPGVK